MLPEKESSERRAAKYATEFRAYRDDAWYTVCVSLEGESLVVKYENFSAENDDVFEASQFSDWEELEDLKERFRPLSKQLQDSECRQLALGGARVCASHAFAHDDVRFYDAVVDGRSSELEHPCTLPQMIMGFRQNHRHAVYYHDRRMEDEDLEGTKNVCMILIANIDKELCPLTITDFLRKHTSISARVFIFPSLSFEVYTRGALMVDSEKEFQELCDFLSNPNCIITSSTGRPWVILEKLVGLKNIKASIGTLMHISEKRKSGRSNNLKVVRSGTKEFKIASNMRDLFLAFIEHQERLHRKLALEERRIFTAYA
uniref:SAWADEE domain-containing protein n=1 Tax=Cajanus cajan TaxID=3821 RepID=A0A151SA77_CAJCA|nr:hypothetical protein KK1_026435 [Cajanus cajan]